MNKQLFFISSCIALFLTSCNDDIVTSQSSDEQKNDLGLNAEEIMSISYDETGELSQEAVFGIMENFKSIVDNDGHTRSIDTNSDIATKVRAKYYVNIENGNVNRSNTKVLTRNSNGHDINLPLYEVVMSDGDKESFAIISADKRMPKVLVYIPLVTDTVLLNKKEFLVPIAMSQASVISELKNIEETRNRLRTSTLDKISKKMNISKDDINIEDVVKKMKGCEQEYEIATRMTSNGIVVPSQQVLGWSGPMSNTAWDQYAPYNRSLAEHPCGYLDGKVGHILAGCGVIGLAETMAILEPSSIGGVLLDWDYIKQTPTLQEAVLPGQTGDPIDKLTMVGKLIEAIYRESETSETWNTDHSLCLSSSTTAAGIQKFLNKYALYSPRQVWNPDSVKRSLDQFHPILTYGNIEKQYKSTTWTKVGHSFIIDGYAICKRVSTTRTILKTKDMYWHTNLGWGPDGKMYFSLNPTTTDCIMLVEDDGGAKYRITCSWQNIYTMIRNKF